MVRVLFTAKQLLEAVLGNVEGVVVVDCQLQVPLDHRPYLFFAFRSEHRRVPFCSPAKSLLFHNPGSSGYHQPSHHDAGSSRIPPKLFQPLISVDRAVSVVARSPVGNDRDFGDMGNNLLDCLGVVWVVRPLLLCSTVDCKS